MHAPIDQLELFKKLVTNSVEIPGPAFFELQQIARDNNIFLSIGVNEKAPKQSIGVLWNTNLIFDRDGINVHGTEIGRMGTLICGENTNSLAKSVLEPVHFTGEREGTEACDFYPYTQETE
jgi:nitrilase